MIERDLRARKKKKRKKNHNTVIGFDLLKSHGIRQRMRKTESVTDKKYGQKVKKCLWLLLRTN